MDEQGGKKYNIAEFLGIGHLIGSSLAFAYFSWQFAKENGFMAWLFFGEFIPMLKSLVWEIYLLAAIFE